MKNNSKMISMVSAALMAVSFFLPWTVSWMGPSLSIFGMARVAADSEPSLWLLVIVFIVAIALAVLAAMGRVSSTVAGIVGLFAVAVFVVLMAVMMDTFPPLRVGLFLFLAACVGLLVARRTGGAVVARD